MRVVVTGAAGQVGRALRDTCPNDVTMVGLPREQLDLGNHSAIAGTMKELRPDVVINAAAYTAVDKAESEPQAAFAINAEAVGALASACRAVDAKLIHISTDFVFDGTKSRPYSPSDAPNPLNVYGASKAQGERRVMDTEGLDWLIVRTAWVYASQGRNFLLTMLRLLRERSVVNVVCDQIGTPTSAKSLASALWCAAKVEGPAEVLHYTDAGVASWYDFAVAIYEEARSSQLVSGAVEIVPISTDQYPTLARRPSFSVLDKSRTLERLGIRQQHWRAALREVMMEMRS